MLRTNGIHNVDRPAHTPNCSLALEARDTLCKPLCHMASPTSPLLLSCHPLAGLPLRLTSRWLSNCLRPLMVHMRCTHVVTPKPVLFDPSLVPVMLENVDRQRSMSPRRCYTEAAKVGYMRESMIRAKHWLRERSYCHILHQCLGARAARFAKVI